MGKTRDLTVRASRAFFRFSLPFSPAFIVLLIYLLVVNFWAWTRVWSRDISVLWFILIRRGDSLLSWFFFGIPFYFVVHFPLVLLYLRFRYLDPDSSKTAKLVTVGAYAIFSLVWLSVACPPPSPL